MMKWRASMARARQALGAGAAALLLSAWALAAGAAVAEAPGRVGRIAQTEGDVWVWDGEGGEWTAAVPNRPLVEGDRLSVDDDGRAEVRIGPTVLRLDGGTELEFAALNDERLEFVLQRGSMALRVPTAQHARQTGVSTLEGRFESLAAGTYRFDHLDADASGGALTRAAALRGALQFAGAGNLRRLDAGEAVEVWLEGRPGVARTRSVALARDDFGEWVLALERGPGSAQAYRYVSPEVTGAEDLDRYGGWEVHPEYGAVWIPTSVPYGWAPFRDGHWSFIRPWGWTWVDAAPWGFAPSHYGRWVRWGARWTWWPGARVVQPVFAPALVAWIGGPSVGLSLTFGGPPAGSWALLGPRDVYRPIYIDRVPRYARPPQWPRHPGARQGGHDRDARGGRDGRDRRGEDGHWRDGRQGDTANTRDRDGRRDGRRPDPRPGTTVPRPGSNDRPTDERGVPIFVPGVLPATEAGREPRGPRAGRDAERGDVDRRGPERRNGDRRDGDPRSRSRDDAVAARTATRGQAVAPAEVRVGNVTEERRVPVFVPRAPSAPPAAVATTPAPVAAPRATPERVREVRGDNDGADRRGGRPGWRPGGDSERGER